MKKLNKLGIIAICVIILSALATTATFSWLARPGAAPVEGNSMQLSASAVVKSDNVDATTYLATLENGILTVGDKVTTSTSITIDSKKTKYFRTVVKNNNASVNNIYLGGLVLSGGSSSLTVNCFSPLKTSASYSSGMAINQHLTVSANGTLNVDWYIYNGSESSKTLTMSTLPKVLYYN